MEQRKNNMVALRREKESGQTFHQMGWWGCDKKGQDEDEEKSKQGGMAKVFLGLKEIFLSHNDFNLFNNTINPS